MMHGSLSLKEKELVAFWTAVPSEKLVVITCHEVLGIDFRKELSLVKSIAALIGDTIQAEINYERMSPEEKKTFQVLKGETSHLATKTQFFSRQTNFWS